MRQSISLLTTLGVVALIVAFIGCGGSDDASDKAAAAGKADGVAHGGGSCGGGGGKGGERPDLDHLFGDGKRDATGIRGSFGSICKLGGAYAALCAPKGFSVVTHEPGPKPDPDPDPNPVGE